MSSNIQNPLHVLVIVASTRPGRIGPAVADWFLETTSADAARDGSVVDVADLSEIGLPLLDEPEEPSSGVYHHEHTRAWSQRVAAADAFVIVTPEYNYGMPAPLKNALDYLYHEWAWKSVGFVSYGNTSAGTRSVQMAKQVVTTLRMMPIGATAALRIADSIEDDQVLRGDPRRDKAARGVLAELSRVARALRPLRVDKDEEQEPAVPAGERTIASVTERDLAELVVLQRACWVQEALANDTLDLAPLRETLADVRAWGETWQVWVVREAGRLIAAVRARAEGSTWHIGRLMVAVDRAGQGIGSWLLAYAEEQAPAEVTQVALYTGRRSLRNIALYERAGFTLTAAPDGEVAPDSVRLVKPLLGPVALLRRDAGQSGSAPETASAQADAELAERKASA
jgi:NAD(P)H-dependent FMN reductase/GNAT superfamily N-acetyltransferase